MSEVWNLVKKLKREFDRLNINRSTKLTKDEFKSLVNQYIDELWSK